MNSGSQDQASPTVAGSQGAQQSNASGSPQGQSFDLLAADQAPSGTQDQGALAVQGIRIGNQVFPNQDELGKAYSELQKKFTQDTQRFSESERVNKPVRDWLDSVRKIPGGLDRLQAWLSGAPATSADLGQGQAQGQAQQNAIHPEVQRQLQEMSSKMNRTMSELEYERFIRSHPELKADDHAEVLRRTIDLEQQGQTRSYEEVYRNLFFERHAASLLSAGQKQAEQAIQRGQDAASLQGLPSSSQVAPKATPYADLKDTNDKNARIYQYLKQAGASFENA